MIFITGSSSAGKTSLIEQLKEQLPRDKFDIHDIDEADKWTDNYESWRDAKIEHWLKQSIKNKKNGIETILCGIIYPEHVAKCDSFKDAQPIKYILLDASAEVIKARFYKRMESRINRQVEISNELKIELEDVDNRDIIDTTTLATEDIASIVTDKIKSP